MNKERRGEGFGHLVVHFIKAYFFPFVTVADECENPACTFALPLGGCRGAVMITTTPSSNARAFYRQQDFISVTHMNDWVFQPKEVTQLRQAVANKLSRSQEIYAASCASATASADFVDDVVEVTSSSGSDCNSN